MNPTNKEAHKMSTKMRYGDKPTEPGYYWIKSWVSSKPPRVVSVWAYKANPNGQLFTNEDGGASVDDKEMYANCKWAGPIPYPQRVTQMLDKIERLQKDANLGAELKTIIAMRTKFTGEPPYVNDAGVILALNESLDERDELREEVGCAMLNTAAEVIRD